MTGGHGHVTPRPDGNAARCGGPAICAVCAKELAQQPRQAAPAAQQPAEPIMQFFASEHLPPHLAAVSRPFAELAEQIVANLPRNAERTVALRKLLEAKDAAVRALVAK